MRNRHESQAHDVPSPKGKADVDATAHEALVHFRHHGQERRKGDRVGLSTAEAADLIALGFVRKITAG